MQNNEADFPKIISSLLIIMKIRNYQVAHLKWDFMSFFLKVSGGKGYAPPSFNLALTKVQCSFDKITRIDEAKAPGDIIWTWDVKLTL